MAEEQKQSDGKAPKKKKVKANPVEQRNVMLVGAGVMLVAACCMALIMADVKPSRPSLVENKPAEAPVVTQPVGEKRSLEEKSPLEKLEVIVEADAKKDEPGTISKTRLAQLFERMSALAKELMGNENVDTQTIQKIDAELVGVEHELVDQNDQMCRQLKTTIELLRNHILGKLEQNELSSEQAARLTGARSFADIRYWDDHYKSMSVDERYDWLGTWDSPIDAEGFETPESKPQMLGDLFKPFLTPVSGTSTPEVLMVGCGNSDMSEKMYNAGFESIVNIDASKDLVNTMRKVHRKVYPKMFWLSMDAAALTFDDARFDVAIDKSTLDAIEGNRTLLEGAISEVHRTLRPGGWLLSTSIQDRAHRVDSQLLSLAKWEQCVSHRYFRTQGEQKKTYYVHACQRSLQ